MMPTAVRNCCRFDVVVGRPPHLASSVDAVGNRNANSRAAEDWTWHAASGEVLGQRSSPYSDLLHTNRCKSAAPFSTKISEVQSLSASEPEMAVEWGHKGPEPATQARRPYPGEARLSSFPARQEIVTCSEKKTERCAPQAPPIFSRSVLCARPSSWALF